MAGFLDLLSGAIPAAVQYRAGREQAVRQNEDREGSRFLKLLDLTRQQQQDALDRRAKEASISVAEKQREVLGTPKPIEVPPGATLFDPTTRTGIFTAPGRSEQGKPKPQYEERNERGGVAVYEDGRFVKWKVTPASERGSDASLTRTLTRERGLRDDYQADPTVKNAYGMANAAAQIRAAAAQAQNPQNDLDIIYSVVKLRDPASVVREGEIDLQRAARSLGTQVSLAWEKAKRGVMLSPQERQQIVDLVDAKLSAASAQIAPIQARFGAQARRYGADSAYVAPSPFTGIGGSGAPDGSLDLDAVIRGNRVPSRRP